MSFNHYGRITKWRNLSKEMLVYDHEIGTTITEFRKNGCRILGLENTLLRSGLLH